MRATEYNKVTPEIIRKTHETNVGFGTSISLLARTYHVSIKKLRDAVREWRKVNKKQNNFSIEKMSQAAKKIVPVSPKFKNFEISKKES